MSLCRVLEVAKPFARAAASDNHAFPFTVTATPFTLIPFTNAPGGTGVGVAVAVAVGVGVGLAVGVGVGVPPLTSGWG